MRYITTFAALLAVSVAVPTNQVGRRQNPCPVAVSSDSPQTFRDSPTYAASANGATTPSGYGKAFTDYQGATQQAGYLTYEVVSSYDPAVCAASCRNIAGCQAFNIYYERDPSVAPSANCTNPASQINVKCAYYSQPVAPETATNTGQYMYDFMSQITGSNGYNLNTVPIATNSPPGYTGTSLGDAVINAPVNCSSYITVKEFDTTEFDSDRCATACDEETGYNRAYLQSRAVCRFFVTYLKYKNGAAISQECALYTASWDASYATNTGYADGQDMYTYSNVYGYSNNAYPEVDSCDCGIGSVCNTATANFTSPATRFALKH